jgi:DNA-binding HxlR family transcriptional regulator
MACSIARSLDVAGEWWTPLILRDTWLRRNRFDEIQSNLDISRKLLTDRLDTLVREGAVERHRYQQRPSRYEYRLTEKGQELMEVFLVLLSWGDRWRAGKKGPPMLLRHLGCGQHAQAVVTCSCCGERLRANEVLLEAGPGGREGWGTQPHPRFPDMPVPKTRRRKQSTRKPQTKRKSRAKATA